MLDPIGGLVVGGMIFKQGLDVGKEAIGELVDKLNDPSLPPKIYAAVLSLRHETLPELPPFSLTPSSEPIPVQPSPSEDKEKVETFPILSIPSIRLFASGPTLLVDVWINLPSEMTVGEVERVIRAVSERVKAEVGERCREVVVRVGNGGERESLGDKGEQQVKEI